MKITVSAFTDQVISVEVRRPVSSPAVSRRLPPSPAFEFLDLKN